MKEVFIRAIIMFIILYIIAKILGKKQIKNLTLYDYVLSITIGSIAADSIISIDEPLSYGIIGLFIFSFIGYIISILSFHNHSFEEIMDGEPLILFENNNFLYSNLDKANFSIAKVLEHCRLKGCFDINELDCAILEPSGDVSILLKESNQPLTSNDLKKEHLQKSNKQTLSYTIVIDGKINYSELKRANKDIKWLTKYLKDEKKEIEEISLLLIDKHNKLTLFTK